MTITEDGCRVRHVVDLDTKDEAEAIRRRTVVARTNELPRGSRSKVTMRQSIGWGATINGRWWPLGTTDRDEATVRLPYLEQMAGRETIAAANPPADSYNAAVRDALSTVRQCPCGNWFSATRRAQVFCSRVCLRAATYARSAGRPEPAVMVHVALTRYRKQIRKEDDEVLEDDQAPVG
jgi:hypothetical protein